MKKHQLQYLMKSRLALLFIIFILAFGVLGGRLLYIGVLDDNDYKQHVLSQQINNMTATTNQIAPKRGTIFDTRGIALAQSNAVYSVIYDPKVLRQLDQIIIDNTISLLSETLEGVEAQQLYDLLEERSMSSYEIIAKGLSYDEIQPIQEAYESYEIRGVAFEKKYERVYPYNNMASDVIGFLSSDDRGLWGIEKKYDDYLSGEVGRRFGAVDDEQMINQEDVEATDGYNLTLNIDYTVQNYIEEAIDNFYETEDALSVKVITMDPRNGHILGMASYPNYDLNDPYNMDVFFGGTDVEEKQEDTSEAEEEAEAETETEERIVTEEEAQLTGDEKMDMLQSLWKNGNVADSYEPGSTFKPFTVAMALEEYLINENSTFYCGGSKIPYEGEKAIHCWYHPGHGEQTVFEALSNSCNVALMDIGELVGRSFFYEYQRMFGFGAVTGIDLTSEESYRTLIYDLDELNPVELQTSSFGQGFNVTPIQLITGFSSLINGGYLYQPQVVSQITASDGRIIEEMTPVSRRKVISEEVSNQMKDALKVVVDEGTGNKASVEGYSIGGKTGTAEKNDRETEDYVVSFIGFSPTIDPEVITLVVVDDPEGVNVNSRYAAAIFKDIMEDVLPYLRVPKEYDPVDSGELPQNSEGNADVEGNESNVEEEVEDSASDTE